MHDFFRIFAEKVSRIVGSGWTFIFAIVLVLGSGVYFKFSEAWKSNASLISTIIALLLLIFLQKSQNHSDKATHLKLDELIKASDGARDELASTENHAEKYLDKLKKGS